MKKLFGRVVVVGVVLLVGGASIVLVPGCQLRSLPATDADAGLGGSDVSGGPDLSSGPDLGTTGVDVVVHGEDGGADTVVAPPCPCAVGFKSCTAGGACVPVTSCCSNADCNAGPAGITGVCDVALGTCSTVCASTATCCPSACPTTPGGAAICTSGACDIACSPASYTCSSSLKTCHPHVITFESGTVEGFARDPVNAPPGATAVNMPLPAARPDGGGGDRALAFPIDMPAAGRTSFDMPLCATGVTNLLGARLSVWVYIKSTTSLIMNSDASIYLFTEGGSYFPLPFLFNPPPINQWFQISGTADLATNANNALAVGSQTIALSFYSNAVAPWAGTVYFDDLTIGP